jgi:hypothetical protein
MTQEVQTYQFADHLRPDSVDFTEDLACREQQLKWDRQSAIICLHNHRFQAAATLSFRLFPFLYDTRKL